MFKDKNKIVLLFIVIVLSLGFHVICLYDQLKISSNRSGLSDSLNSKHINKLEIGLFDQISNNSYKIGLGSMPDSLLCVNPIIYRYFGNECYKCIVSDLSELRKIESKNEEKSIIIISNQYNNRRDSVKGITFNRGFKTFQVPDSFLFNVSNGRKFIALVKNENELENVFIVPNELTYLLGKYITTYSKDLK